MSIKCTVGEYLLLRLKELGIKHIFGVPGDFNLSFLDQLLETKDIDWVGNCNELNAAYAADGYARMHGIAALVTTFGVGELSAVNGIAGSFAEQVPVIAITGSPPTAAAEQGRLLHHTLGDGNFTRFYSMYQEVTAAQTSLTPANAAAEIDRVLQACWQSKRPVYIQLPADVCHATIDMPHSPLLLPEIETDPNRLNELLHTLKEHIGSSKTPVILADYEVNRYQLNAQLLDFVNNTGLPIASCTMGKGVIDESHPQFIGFYFGGISDPYVRSVVEGSDCIINIGVRLSDLTTGGFTHSFTATNIIEIHSTHTNFNNVVYEPIAIRDILEPLAALIGHRSIGLQPLIERANHFHKQFIPSPSTPITQKRFWERFGTFLKNGDVVAADLGTSYMGASTVTFPEGTTFISQPFWASIGYSLPALLGSQLASPHRRNILVIGDGAFQMTAQELSTMIARKLNPVIILLNNKGYTIERAVHPGDKSYNDIQDWNYNKLLSAFGCKTSYSFFRVAHEDELDAAFTKAHSMNKLVFMEVIMDQADAPELLEHFGRVLSSKAE